MASDYVLESIFLGYEIKKLIHNLSYRVVARNK